MGGVGLGKGNASVKELPSVETVGFPSAINSDKTGQLTMNQMTAVEVVDPANRYTISGSGYGLEGRIPHPAGPSDTIEDADPPDAAARAPPPVRGAGARGPTHGAPLRVFGPPGPLPRRA